MLCHLLNHSLGVISVEAMQAGLHIMIASWGSPVGEAALYTALVIHILLALRSGLAPTLAAHAGARSVPADVGFADSGFSGPARRRHLSGIQAL
ncbi:MAG: hypothetical protein WDN69_27170 [Aliidongia sp.]